MLEVGCGSGQLWLVNHHRLPAGWHVTLADLSAGMLATAHRQLSPYGHALRFVVHDAQALPFAAHSFDAIIANHMLYHVPNRPAAYAEFCRVLKPQWTVVCGHHQQGQYARAGRLSLSCPPLQLAGQGCNEPMSDRRQRTGFNLEHGAEELSQWFAFVTLHRYADALVVPEAEPLVAYIRSIGVLTEDELMRFQHHVEEVIERHGPIYISKDVGMFEACQSNPGSYETAGGDIRAMLGGKVVGLLSPHPLGAAGRIPPPTPSRPAGCQADPLLDGRAGAPHRT